MSRLDQHVTAVRNKLALAGFLQALTWTLAALGTVICLAVVVQRLTGFAAPAAVGWALLAAAVVVAVVWALAHRPGDHQAAVAIDDKLGLKEKFSTALHIRGSKDDFAKAALLDAELTAQRVNLARQFPLSFPRGGYAVAVVVAVLLLTWAFFPRGMDVLGQQAKAQKLAQAQAAQQAAHEQVARAMTAVETLQKAIPNNDEFTILQKDLDKILKQTTISDPGEAQRKAIQAMNEVNDALAQQADAAARVAQAQREQLFNSIPDDAQTGPVADAKRDLKNGDYSKFLDDVNKATENFDKKSPEEQAKATQQMAQLAHQLQQMADNPQVQKQIQQQLQQQTGMNAQQAQQMAQAMQQAAQGNPAAQQQVAQMAQKAMQQLNNGAGGPTAQQQAQMQKALSQMQGMANNQQQAAALAQSMQQMASAMGQCQNPGQSGQSGQGAGSHAGGSSSSASQAGQAQMSAAQASMQNAMAQMQAIQQDAASLAACQGSMPGNNNNGSQGNGNPNGSDSSGQWGQAAPTGTGGGQGGPGIGNGGDGKKALAPYGVKQESDPSQDDPNGKILASTFVKDQSIRGESKVGLTKVIESSKKDLSDDVDAEATSGQARQTVEKYFQTVQQDAK